MAEEQDEVVLEMAHASRHRSVSHSELTHFWGHSGHVQVKKRIMAQPICTRPRPRRPPSSSPVRSSQASQPAKTANADLVRRRGTGEKLFHVHLTEAPPVSRSAPADCLSGIREGPLCAHSVQCSVGKFLLYSVSAQSTGLPPSQLPGNDGCVNSRGRCAAAAACRNWEHGGDEGCVSADRPKTSQTVSHPRVRGSVPNPSEKAVAYKS